MKRNEPIALSGFRVCDEIGVGRARALDDSNAAQKRDPAALSVYDCRKPMSR
jgi:hypothetical protein